MSQPTTWEQFRQKPERFVDQVLETGDSVEIEYKGQRLELGLCPPRRDLSKLPRRRAILACSFDELVDTSWEDSWEPDL